MTATAPPRITFSRNVGGELQIWLNETGRDLLVRELQLLSESNDHFHLSPAPYGVEVPLRTKAYCEGDEIFDWVKIMFRPDKWDVEYFPHVLEP